MPLDEDEYGPNLATQDSTHPSGGKFTQQSVRNDAWARTAFC
jgi:hypothetical protein